MTPRSDGFSVVSMLDSIFRLPVPFILAIVAPFIALIPLVVWELYLFYSETRAPKGCRRLGISGKGNLHDQYDKQYSATAQNGTTSWKVKALFIFPIKSCCPVELSTAEVVETGLSYDRQFSFVQDMSHRNKEGAWEIITQRQLPKLAKVKNEVWVPDPDSEGLGEFREDGGCIVVTFPFISTYALSFDGLRALARSIVTKVKQLSFSAEPSVSFRIPIKPSKSRISKMAYPRQKMIIWKDCPVAMNMTSEIPPAALSRLESFLGTKFPLGLFRVDPENYREVYRCAPKKDVAGYQPVTGFADAYPIHIANLAGVHDVASRVPQNLFKKFDAIRFRANIYITGPTAFAEDHWRTITIGDGKYDVSCRCVRCKLPNVDPETGVPDLNHPLSTLTKYRKIDKGATFGPCFGMNLVPLIQNGEAKITERGLRIGEIRVGDDIRVNEVGEHFYIKL